MENFTGLKINPLLTDHGGEYFSNEFEKYCIDNDIRHEMTVRYTPQQNGVSERKNRTIFEMARSMLKAKSSVYLLNVCPTKSVREMTPEEAWSGLKPDVSHLRVFGCVAYAHIPDQRRKKLDDKSVKCIFIKYSDPTNGYKLYNSV